MLQNQFPITRKLALGRAHYLKGDKEKAFECWRAALAIDPQEPEARKCIEELEGR